MKFIDGHYEYSEKEYEDYKPVTSQETVDKLNAYYQLKGSLKKTGPIVKKDPKPVVKDPPKIKSNLTPAEQAELNGLIDKATKGPLSAYEKKRMIMLEIKSDGF